MAASFRKTLTSFKNRLTRQELEQIEDTTLEDVRALVKRIQDEQRARKDAMNFNRIAAFLNAMEQLDRVVKIYANASEYVAFIWGPIKLLLQVSG